MATVMTHFASDINIPVDQVARYAGIKSTDIPSNVATLIDKCTPLISNAAKYKACYLEVPVSISGNVIDFDCFKVESNNLTTLLKGCDKAILVAATIGIEVDMLIKRAEVTSKAEALILNSIAIAGIEKYMFILNDFFKKQYEGYELRPRFSPGYGDVPLQHQTELLNVLDSKRKIGVALNDSLLMTPSKSVTAIIGLGKSGCMHIDIDCELCGKRDCEYRLA
ncbi:MAG: vitamin B12 dependent-methionine synthase activation domain-containing protein [Lachnospiraceae bacterium]|nr:vitamin B12 dependent-methionine synthase activation domain-containing protein [Lachnospiraceae bacterium]